MSVSYTHLDVYKRQVYINDLPERLKKSEGIKISMFADDIIIWTTVTKTKIKRKVNPVINILNIVFDLSTINITLTQQQSRLLPKSRE